MGCTMLCTEGLRQGISTQVARVPPSAALLVRTAPHSTCSLMQRSLRRLGMRPGRYETPGYFTA
jgi:hypothetical protein